MVRYDYDRDDLTDFFREDRRRQERLERLIDDELRMMDRQERVSERMDPVMEVINNPTITMSPAEKKAVNDPKKMMNNQGRIVSTRSAASRPSGRDVIRSSGQFRNLGIPLPPVKRTRKKTKMDKTMSMCLKEANKRMRKKNGQLRKGKTMRDVMRLAHRLCKKS
jgi:hypothetical protein